MKDGMQASVFADSYLNNKEIDVVGAKFPL